MVRRFILALVVAAGVSFATMPTAQADVPQTEVTVKHVQLVNSFQVEVIGTITCDAPGSYSVSVTIRQEGPGQEVRQGSGFESGNCNTGEDTWSVTATGGPFRQGKALVSTFASACDPTCSSDVEDRIMRLQK